jgi:uncharacterized protein (TIGR02284 family)
MKQDLITTCREAARWFARASEQADDAKLRALFKELATERRQYADDLLRFATRFGTTGADWPLWRSLCDALESMADHLVASHDGALLMEAARAERRALAVYARALSDVGDAGPGHTIPPDALAVLAAQQDRIRAAWMRLHTLATVAA